jgi:hypothetical protein
MGVREQKWFEAIAIATGELHRVLLRAKLKIGKGGKAHE